MGIICGVDFMCNCDITEVPCQTRLDWFAIFFYNNNGKINGDCREKQQCRDH